MKKLQNQTVYTTRIDSNNDPIEFSIAMSQFIYHSTKPGNSPNSVILANKDDYKFAIPSAAMIHYPYNGPMLLTDKDVLDKKVENELKRLSPSDYVFLIGNLSKDIEQKVKDLGLNPHKMLANNPVDHAINIYNLLKKPMEIMMVSIDSFEESMLTCSWAAHMGTPIIFTNKDSIPPQTLELIQQNNIRSVYIIGGTQSIAFDIVQELKGIRNSIHVQRIQGKNAYETSVNFMKYKDMTTMFGWGFNKKQGYALSFCNKDHWQYAVCGSILSHTGKHAPMVLIDKKHVPVEVKTYIDSINPSTGMAMPPFLHGYILGGKDVIAYDTQIEIDNYLKNSAWLGNKRIEKMPYKIKSGDSIQSLTQLYNITEEEFMQLNPGLNPDILQIEKTINIPVTIDVQ